MATAFKIDTTPTDTTLAAVTLATTSDPRADLTFEQADGKDPVDISDDEVIAWLGERGIVPPFTADFLDETRGHIGGHRFLDMLNELHRDHPERTPKLVAAFREVPELAEMGDAIERHFVAEAAQSADDRADGAEDVGGVDDLTPIDLPAGMSTAMEALAEEYRSAYFSTDEDAGGKWADAAWKVEAFAPVSDADIAAKLTIGLHYAYPEGRDGRLEIDVGGCECPTAAARILISGIDALAKRAERFRLPEAGLRADQWRAAFSAYEASTEPLKAKGLTDEQVDRLADVESVAAKALFATPAPSFGAIIDKLKAAEATGFITEADVVRSIIVDAERVSVELASPAESASAFDRAHGAL